MFFLANKMSTNGFKKNGKKKKMCFDFFYAIIIFFLELTVCNKMIIFYFTEYIIFFT